MDGKRRYGVSGAGIPGTSQKRMRSGQHKRNSQANPNERKGVMVDPIETGDVAATSNHHHTSAHPAILDKTEARQAGRQKLSFRVLLMSLIVLAIAGLLYYLFVY